MKNSNDKQYRAIFFDLDTNKLKELNISRSQAYSAIKRFMLNNNFGEHRQGSVYFSTIPMITSDLYRITEKMYKTLPWLEQCVKTLDQGKVDKLTSLKDYYESQKGTKENLPEKENPPNALNNMIEKANRDNETEAESLQKVSEPKQDKKITKPVKPKRPKL
jgi:virulence-associated protein VapD